MSKSTAGRKYKHFQDSIGYEADSAYMSDGFYTTSDIYLAAGIWTLLDITPALFDKNCHGFIVFKFPLSNSVLEIVEQLQRGHLVSYSALQIFMAPSGGDQEKHEGQEGNRKEGLAGGLQP